jgi:hypothetical protein
MFGDPRSRKNRPVTGTWRPSQSPQPEGTGRFGVDYVRLALLLGVTAMVGMLGLAAFARPHPSTAKAARARQEAATSAIKRPIPEGMTQDDVVKWVPMRQSSGRTEMAPWTSVDAKLVHDPEVLGNLLQPRSGGPATGAEKSATAPAAEETNPAPATPREGHSSGPPAKPAARH